jgi:ribonucleoside-diphosphate reductase alpha chain
MVLKTYTYQQAYEGCLEYFNNDELAATVAVTKYLLTNNDGEFLERTPDDMHRRISHELARVEGRYPNPMSEEEIYTLLKDFKFVIPQGSPMSGIGNDQRVQSLSNCFVIPSPEDSYGGILKTDQELVQIAKRRGGVGFDLSTIRPKGLPTANAARTTDGIEVFMDRFSNSCREVAQGGRRGALMLTISVHHPQIRDFIKIKRDLKRVTGANISIRVTDEFMKAVQEKEQVQLRWPVTALEPKISEFDSAEEIWHEIVEGAHASAEPGILFWDTAKKLTPSDVYDTEGFGSISTNPCGEIILSPYDSCRLMLMNLTSFVTNAWSSTTKPTFNFGDFGEKVRQAQRLMDDMIDLEIEQVDKILAKIDNDPESDNVKYHEKTLWSNIRQAALSGRRTGLGITGLGDTLAMLGITYGSSQSVDMTEMIYQALGVNSYTSSMLMAKERGNFEVHDSSRENDHPFLARIFDAIDETDLLQGETVAPITAREWNDRWGRRNIANTTTAPAGSVSVLTQTTSGIEPPFMLHYTRRKKLTGQDADARVDFVDESGDKWQEYTVYHHGFRQWMNTLSKEDLQMYTVEDLVKSSPYAGATANEINWVSKVEMQAAAQKWVCHAISNTTNLPSDVDIETVKDVYMTGWELGCKGITVYRDGSRSGVLVATTDKAENTRMSSNISTSVAPKRIDELTCDIHQANIKGEAWTILVGLLNGSPYEVIGGLSEYVEIPRRYQSGKIKKRVRKSVPSKYDLVVGTNGEEFVIKDVVKVFDNPNHSAFTRTISLGLRHGVPVQYMVEQLQKDKDADLFSFSKVIARCLKKYIVDGTKVSNGVFDTGCCDSPNVVYQEGCATCVNCGMAKCG